MKRRFQAGEAGRALEAEEQPGPTGGVEKQEFSAETRRGGADGHGDQGPGHRGAVSLCLEDGALGGLLLIPVYSANSKEASGGQEGNGESWTGADGEDRPQSDLRGDEQGSANS